MQRRPALVRIAGAWGAWALARSPDVGAQTMVEVGIQDYKFTPAQLRIKTGTTVRWTNLEKRTSHSVLFPGPDGFEGERLFPGDAWQHRFDKAGVFVYSCGPHPEMKGQIEVTS